MSEIFATLHVPVYVATRRQPTRNYSVLGLITKGPLNQFDDGPPYWDIVSFIASQGGWRAHDSEKGGDVDVAVSHWCDVPWTPEDQPDIGVDAAIEQAKTLTAHECKDLSRALHGAA